MFGRLSLLFLLGLSACSSAIIPCESDPSARVVCGVQNPEDLAIIPGTKLVVVSEFGSMDEVRPGAIALYDSAADKITPLYPQGGVGVEPMMHEGPDWGAAECEGPPDKRFNPHGIDLRARRDGRLELFVVNHGGREAIELFELLLSDSRYELQWRGCVPMPMPLFMNDVAGLPDSGFVATHMFDRSFGAEAFYHLALATLRFDTGYAVHWHPGSKLRKLGGSTAPFPNGIAASKDGRSIFMNAYMSNEVRHIDAKTGRVLGSAPVAHPDNITWSDDGTLLVASHVGGLSQMSACRRIDKGACPASFDIVSLDPRSMRTRMLLHREGPPMGAATVAVPLGDDLLLGSFRSDRMLRVPR